ncbi:MAG: hypothetical protein HY019_18695 [Aquabacterium sp.]|uniref:hypothetical protein n=1 Tax=Aquabacterium sp. TaxID=1872578 RepID=UPI0025BEE7B0|nr:hypothetical protein [Aquabacterium sp.]MBI3384035.1 hypothetical protein [Aquabacterium sp.]
MTDMTPPPKGSMVLYDYALPPLKPGNYRFQVSGQIEAGSHEHEVANERHFVVDGPRFILNPGDIAGVCPPNNAQGPFGSVLPQIVMRRRTLPWERDIAETLPAPSNPKALSNQQPDYPTPWFALLLLQEGEDYQIKPGVPLEQVLPSKVLQAIGSPQNILVDSLDIDAALLADILPSREELQLLTHVRQVDPNDRELSVEGSDGFFAVQVCNRLPTPGLKAQMVLVSLEGRTDLLKANPPAEMRAGVYGEFVVDDTILLNPVVFSPVVAGPVPVAGLTAGAVATTALQPAPEFKGLRDTQSRLDAPRMFQKADVAERSPHKAETGRLSLPILARKRLVVLHKWSFECEGEGDFQGLMQRLDVGLIGKVKGPFPKVADSGHIPVPLGTRVGTQEEALYRGPLVPFPLTRDPAGPYHSADQARRVSPETGVEDISYAAAFEVGRLLAAADGRLAQELMRWRRTSYRLSARLGTLKAIETLVKVDLGANLAQKLSCPVLPLASIKLIDGIAQNAPRMGDVWGLGQLKQVIGLQPEAVSMAYNLTDISQARQVLMGLDTPLGTSVAPQAVNLGASTTLEAVLADTAGLSHLNAQRVGVLDNVKVRLDFDLAVTAPSTSPTNIKGGQ